MHHKRGRPKNRRAGCLSCKPHKANGVTKRPRSKRALAVLTEDTRRDGISYEYLERYGAVVVDAMPLAYWDYD